MNIGELAKFRGGIATDTISEVTSASGVTIDSVLCKDGSVTGAASGTFTTTYVKAADTQGLALVNSSGTSVVTVSDAGVQSVLKSSNIGGIVTFKNTAANSGTAGALSQNRFSIAQDAATKILPAATCLVLIREGTSTGFGAMFFVSGASISEVSDPSSVFTTTKNNAGTTNVYYDTDGFYVQNKLTGTKNYDVVVLAQYSVDVLA